MFNKACCLMILILVMLVRRITSSPSLIPCNGCMIEVIDVLNNIGDTLAKDKGAESLSTIAGAVMGQQATIKSLIQEQHKTLIKILQDHPQNVEEEATGNRAKQIEQLTQRLETTKQEIDDQIKQKMELLQALRSESKLALDKARSAMEAEISNYQKTSTDSIKSVEAKAAAETLEVKVHITAANSKLQEIEGELGSTREQLKAKIDADRTSILKKLEEGMALVQETVQQLGQGLTSYKTTVQQTTSSLDGRVDKVKQDMASALEKMTSELKGTKLHCITQTTQSKEQMQQAMQNMHHDYNRLKSEILMKQKASMDSIKAVEEKTTANTLEVRAQILAANSKLQTIESELGSTREQLKSKIDGDRTATLKKLEEGMASVHETVQQLRQDLTSYKITSQQTTSSLDGRVVKINQDVLIALEKMTSDLKGVRGLCISQTTQNKEQAQEAVQKIRTNLEELESKTHTTVSQLSSEVEEVNKGLASAVTKMKADVEGAKLSCAEQASKSESQVKQMVNQIQSDLKKHEAQFQKEVDAVKASTETAVKEAKASFIQELESLKQSLQPILKPKVSQQTTTTTTTRTPDYSDYYEFLSVYGDR